MLMRRYIISLLMVFMACGVWAQETYYYCGGKKIPLFTSVLRSSSESYTNANGSYMEATGYLYVKLRRGSDKDLLAKMAEKFGVSIVEHSDYMPLWFVLKRNKENKNTILSITNEIYNTGLFAECAPDLSVDGIELSYDPYVTKQWNLYNSGDTVFGSCSKKGVDINVSEAWNFSTGRNVKIAIVDEGIDLLHGDLSANVYKESYDAKTGKSPSCLYGTHGTHCAGIVAAVRNNGFGITGVSPDSKLMSVSDELRHTEMADFTHARGINWAWKHGADIISCSWRTDGPSKQISEAIDSALIYGRNGLGCVVVKSAGNNGHYITTPGEKPGVITVGNIGPDGKISRDSSPGDNLLVCAPGVNIPSFVNRNDTAVWSGTSMAAPHVSGIVALMLERNPNLTARQVREILAKTATRLPTMPVGIEKEFGFWDEYYGYGLVNAFLAVMKAIEYKQK